MSGSLHPALDNENATKSFERLQKTNGYDHRKRMLTLMLDQKVGGRNLCHVASNFDPKVKRLFEKCTVQQRPDDIH